MKKQILLKLLFLVVPLMLFLNSCKKDNVPIVVKDQSSTESLVNIAKSSLEKQSVGSSPMISSLKSIGLTPDWSDVKTRINSKNKTVLAIPLEKTINSFSELNVIVTNGVSHEVIKKYTVAEDGSILLEFYSLQGKLLKTGRYNPVTRKFFESKSLPNKVSLYENVKSGFRSNGNVLSLLSNNTVGMSLKDRAIAGINDPKKPTDTPDDGIPLEEVDIVTEGPKKPDQEDPHEPSVFPPGTPDTFPIDPVTSPGDSGGFGNTDPQQGDPSKADHQLASAKLPPNKTDDKQVANTCVFKTMEWINKYFGGNVKVGDFLLAYINRMSPPPASPILALSNLTTGGVNGSELFGIVSAHFNTTTTTSIITSLNVGYPVMGTITVGNERGHEVMITGYNNNGTIQYFDPELGTYNTKNPNEFSLLITITGNK